MSDDFQKRDDFNGYSEREILLLLVQKVDASLPVINKRLDSHAGDIKSLREWRNYLSGAWAVVAGGLGIHLKGHP